MSRTTTRTAPATRRPVSRPDSGGRGGYGRGVGARGIEMANPRKRGTILLIVTGLLLTLFAGRLIEIQAVRGEALASEALGQRMRVLEIPAVRGSITDNDGEPLAVTMEARNLTADQTLVTDPVAVATALGPILGVDPAVLVSRLTGDRRFVYLAKSLTPETWNRINELRLPGIFSEPTSRRVYPAGEVGANVVGFVGDEGTGLGGLEYAYEDLLTGTPGEMSYERGPGGRAIPTGARSLTEAKPGVDVRLTIDRDIQYMAQEAIADQVRASQSDSGTVVVMDPRTGDILAMATAPTFDANDPGSADPKVLGNRALTEVFEPGSTAKLMTIAAVVNEGAADAYSWFKIPPILVRGGEEFPDHTPHGTLNLTLAGIMAKSSNIGTILAAERIGGRQLERYLRKFGTAEPTGIVFPGEASGSLLPRDSWSATSLPTIAFGQGFSMNAVQAASVFATIANDGVRLQPRLVDAFVQADGTEELPETAEPARVVSSSTARQVRAMLETVVGPGGTAPNAGIPGYRVGGKTGTAQAFDETCGCYRGVVASFIGMAPIDDPQLVVGVFLDNPRNGRYGGELGGPVFQRVMTYALQARQIPPTGTKASHLPLGG